MEQYTSYLIAILAMPLLIIAWAGVQALWRKNFAEYLDDEDVLADRRSCGNCSRPGGSGCGTVCRKDPSKPVEPLHSP